MLILVLKFSPRTRTEATIEVLLKTIEVLLSKTPLVVLNLEDIQWLDQQSLALLEQISSKIPRLLIVCTQRLNQTVPPFIRSRLLATITMPKFSMDESWAFIANRLGLHTTGVPEKLAQVEKSN